MPSANFELVAVTQVTDAPCHLALAISRRMRRQPPFTWHHEQTVHRERRGVRERHRNALQRICASPEPPSRNYHGSGRYDTCELSVVLS